MGKRDIYKVGDFVFARIQGYRPWPAKVIEVVNKQSYHVYFYGTGEIGKSVKSENLSLYADKKSKLVKPENLRGQYKEAIDQIEAAIGGTELSIPLTDLADISNIDNKLEDDIKSKPAKKQKTTDQKTEFSVKIVDPDTLEDVDRKKLELLELEWSVFIITERIKLCLCLDKANAEKCVGLLEELKILTSGITPMMLKKNPSCVETVKRLRRYVGNLATWKLTDKEVLEFNEAAEDIRELSMEIYNLFKQKFDYDHENSFWISFSKIISDFNEKVRDLDSDTVTKLCFEDELF